MNDSSITTIEQIQQFLKVDTQFQFSIKTKQERYAWIEHMLRKFKYCSLKKRNEQTILRSYIIRVSKISTAQLTVLIKKYRRFGKLIPDYSNNKKNGFHAIYGPEDIALLIHADIVHHHLSGEATKEILVREFQKFKRAEYETISKISPSYIYVLRNTNRQYNSSQAKFVHKTTATQVSIGIRAKPRPNGKPGYVRVDTVHSGDLNGEKGVYHINIVDEVTQFELVAHVEGISELFLKPVIEELLSLYPFAIHEFHSDNGSEFVNNYVAEILARLYIRFTKSRARHSNDNALVESKNGSIIRKYWGRNHIPVKYANLMNEFNHRYVNVYLNYHRPSGFAKDIVDARGKIRKRYTTWMTPYEKLKSLPDAKQYLKPEITFEQLDKVAYAMSDNQFAEEMENARIELYKRMKQI